MKREFDTLPINTSPEEVFSTASLAKAFLDSMGLEHPLEKFSLTNKDHGMQCSPTTEDGPSAASKG
jgi:hypothetical protein